MKPPLLVLAGSLFALTVAVGAAAQQSAKVHGIGILVAGTPGATPDPIQEWAGPFFGGFRDELTSNGYVVGRNLLVDLRSAGGDVSRLPALAEQLVTTRPDVLVTPGTAATVAMMKATKTIPIVFGVGSPVERGIVKSLVDHGGNVTGQSLNLSTPKLWQLLRDAAPTTRRAGVVAYAPNALAADKSPKYRAARMAILSEGSAEAGIEVADFLVESVDELEAKVGTLASGGEAALFIAGDPVLFSWHSQIMEMAIRHRLPTACGLWLGWGEAGCLLTYGEIDEERGKRTAAQVIKILSGTKPADIPIEQPTQFKFIINAKTARALGLALPPVLLQAADEVIE
jgi:putative tryptophan/tyrosine transport system substrate-binding protein